MENKIQRGDYWIVGAGAEKSAHYYDTVISHGYNGDLLYLAWDSAHKFGQRMVGENIASYRDGIVRGVHLKPQYLSIRNAKRYILLCRNLIEVNC